MSVNKKAMIVSAIVLIAYVVFSGVLAVTSLSHIIILYIISYPLLLIGMIVYAIGYAFGEEFAIVALFLMIFLIWYLLFLLFKWFFKRRELRTKQ